MGRLYQMYWINRRTVAYAVDVIFPQLKAKGLEFVTIEQMRNLIKGETK
jgi:hypothetical protein